MGEGVEIREEGKLLPAVPHTIDHGGKEVISFLNKLHLKHILAQINYKNTNGLFLSR